MTELQEIRSEPLTADMQLLLKDFPRESWIGHPNFKAATQNWLGAHKMFRRVGEIIRTNTEQFIDRTMSETEFTSHLSYYGEALVRNLHGHHHWEDNRYFPELSRADSRFNAGLKILEKDHEVLHGYLDAFSKSKKQILNLIRSNDQTVHDEVANLHSISVGIEALLARHLSDEEELAVPIILRYKLRG